MRGAKEEYQGLETHLRLESPVHRSSSTSGYCGGDRSVFLLINK